jgi:two-component system cell cycle sensor histidine kinase/response regulator CckA
VLERRPLDLVPLLKEHVKLLKRTLPESIEIRLDYEPDEYATPFTVNADPTRMQQMVTNLALNARDAMPEGGILRIGLERTKVRPGEAPLLPEMEAGEWVQMTVSDTGTGIPPDALSHIFEPFFTTKERGRGSGLGLAQVHGIVAQHEGRIDVETQVGKGTTFTVYLPVYLSEPSPVLPSTELSALPTGQGETILVVEDDAVVQKALADSLELLNYRVRKASNGQEALAALEGHKREIALVLSDVVMPQMGGIALLHALKEQGLTVPVVMLTGHAVQREMEELRAQGMIDWLPKPPQLEQLAKVVARILGAD